MSERKDIPIHPAAECKRLMTDDEISSLAALIEANGQRDAIILGRVNGDSVEVLIDGRNRLRACELVGINPRFEVIEFADDEAVKAFVADKSEHCDLTKGQRAMRLALLYPEPEKGGRGKVSRISESLGVSKGRAQNLLSQARSVLAYSIELAIAVRDGSKTLDEATAEVKSAREALNSDEARIERLRNEAPDLATLVAEERMKLAEAYAAFEQRMRDAKEKEANRREVAMRITEGAYHDMVSWGSDEFVADMHTLISDPEFRRALIQRVRIDPQFLPNIKRGGAALFKLLSSLVEK